MFCTLNTHNFRSMDSLLVNYLSAGDLIVVHVCGQTRDLSITKSQEYLGLTITDNGHGRAFVKKVKSHDGMIEKLIKPGDHIAAIDNLITVGLRHYEVAKAIREVPHNTKFKLRLIEPLYTEKLLEKPTTGKGRLSGLSELYDERQASLVATDNKSYSNNISSLENEFIQTHQPLSIGLDSSFEDLSASSLPIDRLLSKRSSATITPETNSDNTSPTYRQTIERINSVLESFLGINDNTLAVQIYRLAKENKDSPENFMDAIEDSELKVFNFGKDLESHLWINATSSTLD